MVFLTALAVALLQEIDSKDGWSVSQSGDIAVAAIGGSVTIEDGKVKIFASRRYVFRSGENIVDAVWDDLKLENRRTVTVKGALKDISLMPPLGTIELEGTDGEAELEMEILENKDHPAKPEIDKDGKLCMGGTGVVLRLKGRVPKSIGVKLRAGLVDVTLKGLKGADTDVDVDSSGPIMLTDFDVKTITAESTSGAVKVKGLKATTQIRLGATSGDIDAADVSGKRLDIDVTSGNVNVRGITASVLSIDATSGNVGLADCAGDELKLDTTSGNVLLKGVKYAKREIDTTSGTVSEN